MTPPPGYKAVQSGHDRIWVEDPDYAPTVKGIGWWSIDRLETTNIADRLRRRITK